tara:strand:- start:3573 stop:4547 length:975 start_codon:yes stop_codon:yes gene_type:complete
MASLSGNKIKDTYTQLLKLESAEVSATEQVVEDGAGNNSALKLSTDTVETTGELKISGTPSTSTTDVKALMLSTSGVIVTRDLNANPIGTASITANAPLSATGSTIEIDDPINISQITSPANDDKYLIWDESASEYKYIEQSDLVQAVEDNLDARSDQVIYARLQQNTAVNTSSLTKTQFAEIAGDSSATAATSQATSSVLFGGNANNTFSFSNTGDPRSAIALGTGPGYYRISAVIELTALSGSDIPVDLQIFENTNSVSLARAQRELDASDTNCVEFSALYYWDAVSDAKIELRASTTTANVLMVQTNSYFKIENIGANITF